jgi:hypothetical protein
MEFKEFDDCGNSSKNFSEKLPSPVLQQDFKK